MLDSADAEVANVASTALARMPEQGAAAAESEERGTETVTALLAATIATT